MKFVINKQTGVFVLREDLTSGIKAAARDLTDLEGKKLKTLEDVTRAVNNEYKNTKRTKEQKKTEFNEAEERLKNQKSFLLFYNDRNKPSGQGSYTEIPNTKAVALYLTDNKNSKPTKEQIDNYILFLSKKDTKIDPAKLEQIKKDINTYVNYSEEEETIDPAKLEEARKFVRQLILAGKILAAALGVEPLLPFIGYLYKILCVQPPDEIKNKLAKYVLNLTGFDNDINTAIEATTKLLSVEGVQQALIRSTPLGGIEFIKSLYIVIKHKKQCPPDGEETEEEEVDDEESAGPTEATEATEAEPTKETILEKAYALRNEFYQTKKYLVDNDPLAKTDMAINFFNYFETYFVDFEEKLNGRDFNVKDNKENIENYIAFFTKEVDTIKQAANVYKNSLKESKILKEYREEINNLLIPHMQKQLGFNHPPTINFADDQGNAQDMFGKTAYYNPSTSEITVYITNRHPKDIMRSVAHEIVHHAQNQRGEFENSFNLGEEGYAQNNSHLRSMEEEAYLSGNMMFRDWEDQFKKQRNQKTMVNETNLRAKIRSMIAEEIANQTDNEPAKKHEVSCGCKECKIKNEKILKNKGLAEAVEKELMPLREWRNMELNSLLLNRFGISSPHVLGEKKNKKPDEDGDGVPDWADKKPKDPKVGAKKTPTKKGKIPPQFLKGKKKDESK